MARSFGCTPNLSRSRPIIDGTKRPRLSDGIVKLAGSAENSGIGGPLFSRLSAVDHMTWFGLQWAMHLDEATADESSRTATAAIGADGVQVSAIGFYLVRAVRAAATARFELMGWTTRSGRRTRDEH